MSDGAELFVKPRKLTWAGTFSNREKMSSSNRVSGGQSGQRRRNKRPDARESLLHVCQPPPCAISHLFHVQAGEGPLHLPRSRSRRVSVSTLCGAASSTELRLLAIGRAAGAHATAQARNIPGALRLASLLACLSLGMALFETATSDGGVPLRYSTADAVDAFDARGYLVSPVPLSCAPVGKLHRRSIDLLRRMATRVLRWQCARCRWNGLSQTVGPYRTSGYPGYARFLSKSPRHGNVAKEQQREALPARPEHTAHHPDLPPSPFLDPRKAAQRKMHRQPKLRPPPRRELNDGQRKLAYDPYGAPPSL